MKTIQFFKTGMLVLFLTGMIACGGVSKQDALDYNESIINGQLKVIAAFDAWNASETQVDSFFIGLTQLVDSELKRAEALNNLGDDADFKNAYITFLTQTKDFLNKEDALLKKVDQMIAEKTELTQEEADEVKKEEEALNAVYDQNQNDFLAKQKAFVAKYGLELEEAKK
ncbi:MAG: hypothetical protein FGM41_11370 [Bacteroidetes bacterium]|nr:hypothetical protein [Bacteroidota bacterium]